ncbi:MAG: CHC2 zinc finger domain-containing protein [Patescibacteria group bacterium]
MSIWIDFKELRSKLSFEQVLQHYKVELKTKGSQHHGFCPLPNHEGKKNSPSFSASLEKKIFQCFGCGAKGNILDFAVLMEGGKPGDGDKLRNVAVALRQRFGLEKNTKSSPSKEAMTALPAKKAGTVLVNAKLDFELKTLDFDHPYLRSRGFTDETIHHFGLGYCSKGFLQGRVAVPLHDQLGRLVGYAGRIVDDSIIDEDNPRYKFPGQREHKGITYEFRKSEFLYGGYRIKEPVDDLVVVEGFPSVWWFHQLTIPNCVGLMGWSCSEAQAKLIIGHTKPNGRVWLLSDGDDAGIRCAESFSRLVARDRFIRWIKLHQGKQPTDYQEAQLRNCLNQ